MKRGTSMVKFFPGPQVRDLRHRANVREREWWHWSLISMSHVEHFYLMPCPKFSPIA